jgi:hypothetical protein
MLMAGRADPIPEGPFDIVVKLLARCVELPKFKGAACADGDRILAEG